MDNASLIRKAAAVRLATLEMIVGANKGHIGGCFSSADILTALYFGGVLRQDPCDPSWEGRDRFILSKGHACEGLYVVLAELGFFSKDYLDKYQRPGGILGGHPDRSIPGIEADTGALGHGLGIGCGMALAARMDSKDFLTVVLMGDGECCEGSVWESAMFAARHQLGRLVAIIDKNDLCVTDRVGACMAIDPLGDKWKAFGWDVCEVNGHDMVALMDVLGTMRTRASVKPLMIVAQTVKAKGVSCMEGGLAWHHGVPKGEVLETARRELRKACA
ncbi:MAG: transketolase [Candidatus Omnitrophica bacterium]|nr:transketolase [Candidatus Omnitrophota bacterium]